MQRARMTEAEPACSRKLAIETTLESIDRYDYLCVPKDDQTERIVQPETKHGAEPASSRKKAIETALESWVYNYWCYIDRYDYLYVPIFWNGNFICKFIICSNVMSNKLKNLNLDWFKSY